MDDIKVAVFCTLIVVGWLDGDKDPTYFFFEYVMGFRSDVDDNACDSILLVFKEITHDCVTIATI